MKHTNKKSLCFCAEVEEYLPLRYDLKLKKYVPSDPSDEWETWEEHYFEDSPPYTLSIGSHSCSITTHWRHPSEAEFEDSDEICFYCAKKMLKIKQKRESFI
mgnify:FL=1